MRIHKVIQGTDAWKRIRLGKITGTRIKNIAKADNLSVVDELIAETISDEIEEDGFINEAMQRGIDYEPLARSEYEKRMNVKVEEFGFLQHSEHDWLGLSPDGLIKSENGKYEKGIEIKCPSTATHVRYIRMNSLPNEYKYQVYNYFLVCQDIQTVDFISYDTRFGIKPMHIITIKRDDIQAELTATNIMILKFWNEKFKKYYEQVTF
jgi:putative phage-type endonuclease